MKLLIEKLPSSLASSVQLLTEGACSDFRFIGFEIRTYSFLPPTRLTVLLSESNKPFQM